MALLEGTFGKLRTSEVIVTNERLSHIQERHPQDFLLFEQYGAESIRTPDWLIRDEKHEGTIFVIKKLPDINLNVVLRLALETDDPTHKNSVMTFYRLRDKNLRKILEKNRLLYSRE